MARLACALAWLLAASAFLCSGPAGCAPVDCSAVIFDMIDCLDYVSAGSAAAAPDEACCEGIKKVVRLSPSCLCDALRQAVSMRVDVNTTRAGALPAACKISSSVAGLKPCDHAAGPPSYSPGPVHHAPSPSPPKAPTPPPSPAPTSPAPAPSSPSGEASPAPSGFPGGSAPAPSASGAFSLGLNVAGDLVVSVAAAIAAACL